MRSCVTRPRTSGEVDRGPPRASDVLGSRSRGEHDRRGGSHERRRHPRLEGRHDRRHRRVPGDGRHDQRAHRVDASRSLQDGSARLHVQRDGDEQGAVRRVSRPVGGRDVHPRAPARHRRSRGRHRAARAATPQRGHSRRAAAHDDHGSQPRRRHRPRIARADGRDHRSALVPRSPEGGTARKAGISVSAWRRSSRPLPARAKGAVAAG